MRQSALDGKWCPLTRVTDVLAALDGTSLLDLDADLTADLDLAAPIAAAVGANANLAVPIDAAVSANVLSPDATSLAQARSNCSRPPLVPGGRVTLTQYVQDALDRNHSCI